MIGRLIDRWDQADPAGQFISRWKVVERTDFRNQRDGGEVSDAGD